MTDSTIVVKEATTWGTAVTPDRGVCLLRSGESLDADLQLVQSQAHCWGQLGPHAAGEALISQGAKGAIPMEVSTRGFGLWWKLCLGSSAIAQIGTSDVYQQLHKLDPGARPVFTAQKLVQSIDAAGALTTVPFTFPSLLVSEWELKIPESGIATLSVTTIGKGVVTSTAAVVPPARAADDHLLHSGGASLATGAFVAPTATALATAASPIAGVKSLTIKGDNNLISRRTGWGDPRPIPGQAAAITGTLDVEFVTGGPFVTAFLQRQTLSLLANLAAIENGDEIVQIAIPSLRVGGEIPKAGNPSEIQTISVPFTAMRTTSPELVYVVHRGYDTAI